jgi:hypothetical protein
MVHFSIFGSRYAFRTRRRGTTCRLKKNGALRARPFYAFNPGQDMPEATATERWSSVEEVTEHLGVGRDTIYRWIERKRLPHPRWPPLEVQIIRGRFLGSRSGPAI